MNNTTPYEKLIAAKLEEMPVPDMADSIWASIDMQLDAVVDTPEENPVQPSKPVQPFKINTKGWFIIAGVVMLIGAIWWYIHSQSSADKTVPPTPVPEKTIPVPAAPVNSSSRYQPPGKGTLLPLPPAMKKDSISIPDRLPQQQPVDSIHVQPVPVIPVDSPAIKDNRPQERIFDSIYVLPTHKKPRGVKGITPNDYRISVQKDSTHKQP